MICPFRLIGNNPPKQPQTMCIEADCALWIKNYNTEDEYCAIKIIAKELIRSNK